MQGSKKYSSKDFFLQLLLLDGESSESRGIQLSETPQPLRHRRWEKSRTPSVAPPPFLCLKLWSNHHYNRSVPLSSFSLKKPPTLPHFLLSHPHGNGVLLPSLHQVMLTFWVPPSSVGVCQIGLTIGWVYLSWKASSQCCPRGKIRHTALPPYFYPPPPPPASPSSVLHRLSRPPFPPAICQRVLHWTSTVNRLQQWRVEAHQSLIRPRQLTHVGA